MALESAEQQNINNAEEPKDCLSCKLVTGSTLLVASAYVLFRGIKARSFNTRITSAVFGSSLGYTGIARLLDLYPFNEVTNTKQKMPADS